MEEVTIVVVDDHPLFRQGVVDTLSLEPEFKIIGQAANGTEALDLIRELHPMVALVDINLPGMNGQEITHEIAQEKISSRIILLTAYDDHEQIIHAAHAGAAAYCAKDIPPESLVKIVREVIKGNFVMQGKVLTRNEFEQWLDAETGKTNPVYSEPGSPYRPLSDREAEVLQCVVKGLSNKEIAALLGISHQTVKNHITSILRKFCVEDRTQAVVYALKRGWVKLTDNTNHIQE